MAEGAMVDRAGFEQLVSDRPAPDRALLARALTFAATAHRGQTRVGGDPYLTHPLAVAATLAETGLDTPTLVAALLHDVIEDCGVTPDQLTGEFGPEIAFLVEGVSKISALAPADRAAAQAESLRKMLLAMGKDLRVILIKLADRQHNLETAGALPQLRRERMARETLDIYAPLAHRLGMERIKNRLQDLAFALLYPEEYQRLEQQVNASDRERQERVDELIGQTEQLLRRAHLNARVSGRPKNLYAIREKMQGGELPFARIYDLIGLRVITAREEKGDCYAALGAIHSEWHPVPGRFKDYLAVPKSNLYRSLHTTVVTGTGKQVEFQIRTAGMHRQAEDGIAAHWLYKEEGGAPAETAERFSWYRRVLETIREVDDPKELMKLLRVDFLQKQVYVLTPGGHVKELPAGSTPVDFAFAVHTEVGKSCTGARVNGRIVPLAQPLQSGEVVEIITTKGHRPSRDWLAFVKSSAARSHLRRLFNETDEAVQLARGRELLDRAARQDGVRLDLIPRHEQLPAALAAFQLADLEALYRALAAGRLAPRQFLHRLTETAAPGPSALPAAPLPSAPPADALLVGAALVLDGISDPYARMAQCCHPVPGDEIFGYVTRGRGVTVHRRDCPNVAALFTEPARILRAAWQIVPGKVYRLRVEVEANDRIGLLADCLAAIAAVNGNVVESQSAVTDGVARCRFDLEVSGRPQLQAILKRLQDVKGITRVYRR